MVRMIKASWMYFLADLFIWFIAHNLPVVFGLLIQSYFNGNDTIDIALIFFALTMLRLVCITIGAYADAFAQHKWAEYLYKEAYNTLKRGNITADEAGFVNAVNEDVSSIVSTVSYMIDTICNLIYGIIVIVILAMISIPLTIVVVVFPIIAVLLNSMIKKKVEYYAKQEKDISNDFSKFVNDTLTNARRIRVSGKQKEQTAVGEEIIQRQQTAGKSYMYLKGIFSTLSSMVAECNLLFIIVYFTLLSASSMGNVALFITYSFDLSGISQYVSTLIILIQDARVYMNDFYEKLEVVKEENSEVRLPVLKEGTINVLIGPNGSGKSFILKAMQKEMKNAVLLPENYHLFTDALDVNIRLDEKKEYPNDIVSDIPNTFNPNEISGGQKFRTALLRTMIRDENIILIDHNLMSVDEKQRKEIYEYMLSTGKTIVLTDHDERNEYKDFNIVRI